MTPRKSGLVVLAFALLAFGGSMVFVVKHAADADSERQYEAAQPCMRAEPPTSHCFEVITATVTSKTGGGSNNYSLDLLVPGIGQTSEGLAAGDRSAIYSRLTAGGPVSVKVWQREVTLVLVGDLRAATFRNPTYTPGDDIRAAVILAAAGVLGTVQAFFTARSTPRRDWSGMPDPELDSLSGPFGMDGAGSLTVTREYSAAPGASRTTGVAIAVIAGSLATAIRIDGSLLSLAVGGAVGVVLFAAAIWIARATSVVVGPRGITLRRPWGSTTAAWSDVLSARVTRRGYVVRWHAAGIAGGSTKTWSLTPFLQSGANVSLPRLVALYLARQHPDSASQAPVLISPETNVPADQQLVPAGFGARLGAWAIDVLTAAVLWFIAAVLIEVVLSIPYGGHLPDSVGSATVFIAIGVTVPAYAIPCWHAGRTLGLLLLGMYVVDAKTGGRLSWGQCLVRFAGALPSIVLVIPFGLFMAAGAERLALHDRIARSAVVVRAKRRQRTVSVATVDQAAP